MGDKEYEAFHIPVDPKNDRKFMRKFEGEKKKKTEEK